jgi:hypothetical protein
LRGALHNNFVAAAPEHQPTPRHYIAGDQVENNSQPSEEKKAQEFVHSPQELQRKEEAVHAVADDDDGRVSLGEIPVVVDEERDQ